MWKGRRNSEAEKAGGGRGWRERSGEEERTPTFALSLNWYARFTRFKQDVNSFRMLAMLDTGGKYNWNLRDFFDGLDSVLQKHTPTEEEGQVHRNTHTHSIGVHNTQCHRTRRRAQHTTRARAYNSGVPGWSERWIRPT